MNRNSQTNQLRSIDQQIIKNLAKRQKKLDSLLAKAEKNGHARTTAILSSKELQNLLLQAQELGVNKFLAQRVFTEINSYNRKRFEQQQLATDKSGIRLTGIRIACQGGEASSSYLAVMKYFSGCKEQITAISYPGIHAAVKAVKNGEVDYAMLPAENTIGGSINQTFTILANTEILIAGEEIWQENHCLLTLENIALTRLRRIYADPIALEQCSDFVATLSQCTVECITDSAEASNQVKLDQDITHAAIGSSQAAEVYGLKVKKKEIANSKQNYTRFVLVGKNAPKIPKKSAAKTSLLLITSHEKGSLVKCLNLLTENNINMTKLESRPIVGAPWEYMFYIDIEGKADETQVKKALDKIRQQAMRLKILGTYPICVESGKDKNYQIRLVAQDIDNSPAKQRIAAVSSVAVDLPFKLASLAAHPGKSSFKVGKIKPGIDFTIIAGPCAVESKKQIMDSAAIVRDGGGHILRGGVFKPRTSPYSFQGLGAEGLEYLAEAGHYYDLPIITEVVCPEDVELVAAHADILQIGARNMQNFALLQEAGLSGKPIFLKRGMMASIEEWLLASEYILAQGNQQVILCERGIRSFDTATRNTLDISAVPVCRSLSHLPVFIDPSHACGVREWVTDLAAAGAAVGADGIMIEIHPYPEKALCDKDQALTAVDFKKLVKRVNKILAANS